MITCEMAELFLIFTDQLKMDLCLLAIIFAICDWQPNGQNLDLFSMLL